MRLGTCFYKKEEFFNEKEIMDEVVFCIPAYFYYPIYNILFFEKVPLSQIRRLGKGESLQSILEKCHRESFEEAIPLETEASFYYFFRHVTLWHLEVVGEVSCVNIEAIKEHFEVIDKEFHSGIFLDFPNFPNKKFLDEIESYKFHRVYNGSHIYLVVSSDCKYYFLEIHYR